MTDFEQLKAIANENQAIIQQGFYQVDKKIVELPNTIFKVDVYSPDSVCICRAQIQNGEITKKPSHGLVSVDMLDSFNSAEQNGYGKTIVLNFANAFYAGGAYLHGWFGQEETLCRKSSLYASISSKQASEMYDYNKAHVTPEGSNYILYSPNVAVFRNDDLQLKTNIYCCGVITCAAPNLNRESASLKGNYLKSIMLEKIENLFAVAATNKCDTLILGAWGCGAFKHDPRDVSDYFYTILYDKGYIDYFERIVFSIYSPDGLPNHNYNEFLQKFTKHKR